MDERTREDRAGMPGCDREVFSRVWARVSPHGEENCPIVVLPPERRTEKAVELPVLQKGGHGLHGGEMRAFIGHELEDWRLYQAAARRWGGQAGRLFASLGEAERRHAGQLSAAWLLTAGVEHMPCPAPQRVTGELRAFLHRRFREEREGAQAYLAAAQGTEDPTLAPLLRSLAEEEETHAQRLRRLMERL